MGNVAARLSGDYVLKVKTGDCRGAGTDANVWIVLHDECSLKTQPIKLSSYFRNDHEKSTVNCYYTPKFEGLSLIQKVEIWRDSFGFADDWYLDWVVVEHRKAKTNFVFPVSRWIKPNRRYVFVKNDCILPQHDENRQQRLEELAEKKQLYEYTQNIENGPVQVMTLPEAETIDNFSWDLRGTTAKLKLDLKLIGATCDKWETLQDLKNIFKLSIAEPTCLSQWNDDKWFAAQRLQGLNPLSITLCKEIPEKFGVSAVELEPLMENLPIDQVISEKRLFLTDLQILKNLPCKDDRTICAPMALFFLTRAHDLIPIAIQLFQDKTIDNPVFYPNDPSYTWMLAKMFYNNADSTYHRVCHSIGRTHLLMESVWICTNRNLSQSHPVYKLLAPHFCRLMAVNASLMEKFMAMGGWIDRVMTIGMRGLSHLIARSFSEWTIDETLNIPKEIESREVIDPEVLPYYPFRDDAIILYTAVEKYVSKIINHYYELPENIVEDLELQMWRKELVKSRENGGCNIKGVPGDDQTGFSHVEHISATLTAIIANCTIFHAAINFQQYDECAFPPNYPLSMRGFILRDKHARTQKDILDQLPNKETTFEVLLAMRMFSTKPNKSLGNFETQYLFDDIDVVAHDEFIEELAEINETFKKRNGGRKFHYPWLYPENIPNSVSV